MSIVLERRSSTEPVEMIDLFELDGEMYQIPAQPKINMVLKYLNMARTESEDKAIGWLLEQMVGEDAYHALMDFDDLTADQLKTIMMVVENTAMGALENPSKPSRNGRKKSRG